MDTNNKDFLIYKYGTYNFALGKSLSEAFGVSDNTEFYIKLSVKLLHYLYLITGKLDLPRLGVYTKKRLAKIATKELDDKSAEVLCSLILTYYPYLDRELIKKAICWNILNTENFGNNKFKME